MAARAATRVVVTREDKGTVAARDVKARKVTRKIQVTRVEETRVKARVAKDKVAKDKDVKDKVAKDRVVKDKVAKVRVVKARADNKVPTRVEIPAQAVSKIKRTFPERKVLFFVRDNHLSF